MLEPSPFLDYGVISCFKTDYLLIHWDHSDWNQMEDQRIKDSGGVLR